MNDKVGVATPVKKKAARLHAGVPPRARFDMLHDSSIIQLDYSLEIIDTPSLAQRISDCLTLIGHREEAMCAFTVDLIDFDQLSDAQKKALLKNLQRKKNTLQAQLEDVNESLKGINRALKVIERKSKSRA